MNQNLEPRRVRRPRLTPATFFLSGVLALIIVAACDSDSPVQPGDSCGDVSGNFEGSIFGEIPLTGDLKGTIAAYKEPIVEPNGMAFNLQTFHLFSLEDGTFSTEDKGVQAPIDPPLYHLSNHYKIVSGTGAYEKASGYVIVHGMLVTDFTGEDPRNGNIEATYWGVICR